MEPAAVSRTVPRVCRLTRLAGHDRMTGDTPAIGSQSTQQRSGAADCGEYRQVARVVAQSLKQKGPPLTLV